MTTTVENIIKISLFAADIITVSTFIYSSIKALRQIIFSKANTELNFPDITPYNIDLFTQKKYSFLGVLCVGLPLLTISVILLTSETLNKADTFMLAICPCIVLFYATFVYFCNLTFKFAEIYMILIADLVATISKKPLTIQTSKGLETFPRNENNKASS